MLYTVWNKFWPRMTGIEPNAITGIVAFSGLAALGAWKEVNGVEVWTRSRVKSTVGLSLLFDIAQTVLVGIVLKLDHDHHRCTYRSKSAVLHFIDSTPLLAQPHIPEIRFGLPPAKLAQIAFPAFRVLLVAPLFITLIKHRVVWTPLEFGTAEDEEAAPTDTSLLLAASASNQASTGLQVSHDASKYGTFSSASSNGAATATSAGGALTPTLSASGAPIKVRLIA